MNSRKSSPLSFCLNALDKASNSLSSNFVKSTGSEEVVLLLDATHPPYLHPVAPQKRQVLERLQVRDDDGALAAGVVRVLDDLARVERQVNRHLELLSHAPGIQTNLVERVDQDAVSHTLGMVNALMFPDLERLSRHRLPQKRPVLLHGLFDILGVLDQLRRTEPRIPRL